MIDLFYIFKKFLIIVIVFFIVFFLLEIYLPKSIGKSQPLVYAVKSGSGYRKIAKDLENQGVIKSAAAFRLYSLVSLNYSKLQAGKYELSKSMSIAKIVKKFSSGDVVRKTATIIEGWNINDIAENLQEQGFFAKEEFINETKKDFSGEFSFLKDNSKEAGLEGYIFPDTYYLSENPLPRELLQSALKNFDKKMTPELKQEIEKQGKTIFEIITMASMIEKEVASLEDKKVVAGILWKRVKEGIPLQVDATVNYVTRKHDKKVAIKDTQIDSPYNTYKYYGLPLGPISNPGMDSIMAAIYPKDSPYLYYLSTDGNGTTIFSKTLEEHIAAQKKYFE